MLVAGSSPPAFEGTRRAWLAGHGERKADRLWQQVALPASTSAISVTFALRVETEEEGTVPYDSLRVRIRDQNGALLATAAVYTNLHATDVRIIIESP